MYKPETSPVKVEHRRPLDSKVTWNGTRSTFAPFKELMEGHFLQNGGRHLVQTDFLQAYKDDGYECIATFPHLLITRSQLIADNAALYGAIKSACRLKVARKILLEYTAEQDGMLTWLRLLREYDNQGSTDVQTLEFDNILDRKFTRHYHGGLEQFAEDYDTAYAELSNLGEEHSDHAKRRRILQNLFTADNEGLVNYMQDNCPTFDSVIKHLKATSIRRDHYSGTSSRRRAHNATTIDDDDPSFSAEDVRSIMQAMSGKGNPSDYRIPRQAWLLFDEDMREKYMDARRTAGKDNPSSSSRDRGGQTSNNTSNAIPKQYGSRDDRKGNNLMIEDGDGKQQQEETDTDSEDERLEQLAKVCTTITDFRRIAMARIDSAERTVRVTVDPGTIRTLLAAMREEGYMSIADGGADTSVIGDGWYVTSYTQRTANIVGFDEYSARKHGLPIVSASTLVELTDGTKLIITIHEAVYNKGSRTTLLSNFQLRHHGCIVDDVAKQHRGVDGKRGTQRIESPEDKRGQVQVIPMHLRSALMTFSHRTPTKEEMDEYPNIELTDDMPWHPRDHNSTDADANFVEPIFGTTVNANQVREAADNEEFHDSTSQDAHEHDERDVFFDSMANEDEPYYFDSTDALDNDSISQPIPLSIDYSAVISGDAADAFLSELEDTELRGDNETFDAFAYASRASAQFDLQETSKFLGYRPVEVIQKTLEATTQLAKTYLRFPMRRHVQSRFPQLNRIRLRETVATDTYFANARGVTGSTCAQVYYGLLSHMINVYGMRREGEAPDTYLDFIRKEGAPNILRSDNAQVQIGKRFTNINRKFIIDDQRTEPDHAQQNPAELRAVQFLKSHSQVLMDRTKAPEKVWLQACEYIADVHNICADETLGWRTPHEKRHGDTPDISAYLQFQFYEKVLYLDPTETFPATKEKPGYWLGISHNVGDSLTFKILTDSTEEVIHRSVVRPANDRRFQNQRVRFDPELDPDVTPDPDTDDDNTEPPQLQIQPSSTQNRPRNLKAPPQEAITPPTTPPSLQHYVPEHLFRDARRQGGSRQPASNSASRVHRPASRFNQHERQRSPCRFDPRGPDHR